MLFSSTTTANTSQNNEIKPNIVILETGKTIASRGRNSMVLTDYGKSTRNVKFC